MKTNYQSFSSVQSSRSSIKTQSPNEKNARLDGIKNSSPSRMQYDHAANDDEFKCSQISEVSVISIDEDSTQVQKYVFIFFRKVVRTSSHLCRQLCSKLMLLLDMENIWDSPFQTDQSIDTPEENERGYVMTWFVVLVIGYVGERTSFKMLSDRAGPYRLFSAEAIILVHSIVLGVGLISLALRKKCEVQGLGIPFQSVGLMALIDTMHLQLSLIFASHTSPVLTVILVQLSSPLISIISKIVSSSLSFSLSQPNLTEESSSRSLVESDPNRHSGENIVNNDGDFQQSQNHKSCFTNFPLLGDSAIVVAVLLSLIPAFMKIQLSPENSTWCLVDISYRTAWNCILFSITCVLSAVSSVYKEKILLKYQQPVEPTMFNFLLSIFQLFIGIVLSPILYPLQGIGAKESAYNPDEVGTNFIDGMNCFLGGGIFQRDGENVASEHTILYSENASCKWSLELVFVYVLSIILVGIAVDNIVTRCASKVIYKGISVGVFFSLISMQIYDMQSDEAANGCVKYLYFVCSILIFVGSFSTNIGVNAPDASFETEYPEVGGFYDDR